MLRKIMCVMLVLFCGGFMGSANKEVSNISEVLLTPDKIIIYNNNTQHTLTQSDENWEEIVSSIKEMTQDCHEMPAFGVSLDNETRKAREKGLWIELVYNKTQTHNDMPFDSLLFEIVPEYSGFNLIRLQNGLYEGRCFYLQLSSNMQKLYNAICEM